MDRELEKLLARARQIKPTADELEEQRIMIAAANGHISDSRITVETMRAARTIMVAGAMAKTKLV
jgi:prefoldin subunit 5